MSSSGSTPRSKRQKRSGKFASPASSQRRTEEAESPALQHLPPSSPEPQETSLLFSESGSRKDDVPSEMDMSSPLKYGTPSSKRGTPSRMRSDLGSATRLRQVNVPGSDATSELGELTSRRDRSEIDTTSDISEGGPKLVIWGTNVVISETKAKFSKFLKLFIDDTPNISLEGYDDTKPIYIQYLDDISQSDKPFLDVNLNHVKKFDRNLYIQVKCYPQEVIPTFDIAVNELFQQRWKDVRLSQEIQVRTYNVSPGNTMRSLNPEDIDTLITITGMVTRTSSLIPEMRQALFQCSVCMSEVEVEIDRGVIAEPEICRRCNVNHGMVMLHNRSIFGDKQIIKLQESPDDMPAGQTPQNVLLTAHNDLVDSVQPGDRVACTGIYRATPLRVNPLQRNMKCVYKTHIDVIHFNKTLGNRLRELEADDDNVDVAKVAPKFTAERKELLMRLSRRADIYSQLAQAIAPSIYEHEDIKKGILMQLFGGTRKDFSDKGRGHFRSEINILLCGDPGTSKSQLLQYVHNLTPRGQYTSGKGTSAVGLTAYVTKDPETRQLVLQTGALVLSDNGICCIDEFDKMSESTRSVLHEVMEQQTLSIAKAGIICQLNARASVLAAANPVDSQWNMKKTVVDNVMLPHTLLSRFDLIFLMLDPQDELFDRRLGSHLVSLYHRGEHQVEEELLDLALLRDYIAYGRYYVKPQLSQQAGQLLVEKYVEMRKAGSIRGQVSAYPRQLESLIRLGEAHARMRFSDVVDICDVEEAHRLHREALKQSAIDPVTGTVDINILTTGMTESARHHQLQVSRDIWKILKELKQPVVGKKDAWRMLIDQSEKAYSRIVFDEALKILQDDDHILITNQVIRIIK